MVEVKNGFMVFREGVYEMWSLTRECLGREELGDKVQSAVYLPEQESFFYGSSEGSVVEMYNYEKMMRLARERDQASERNKLVRQVEELRGVREELRKKLNSIGGGIR